MHIYHHTGYGAEQSLEWYQYKKSVQKITIQRQIEDLLFEFQHDADRTFLLDERYFDLIRCPIQGMMYEPLTIEQLNDLVEQKVQEIRDEHRLTSTLIMYDNENIRVDGQDTHYLLAQK